MAIFTVGARLHDYGKGTPDELFGKVSADGFACVQLAYKKCVPGVASYADVTPQLVQNTLEAQKKHNIAVAVLGTYVELAIADEVQRSANAADFKSQLAVCKALNAGCIGTETTGMHKQPAGTTRERAQYMLCKSLETILPEAERLGVTVAIEPVVGDSTNTPQAARHILDMMQSPALGVILDMSNLVSFEGKDNQQPLWDAMGELLGDKIKAVHFKGKNFGVGRHHAAHQPGRFLHRLRRCLCHAAHPAAAVARSARGSRARPCCQRYCFYQTVFLTASFCPTGPEYLH